MTTNRAPVTQRQREVLRYVSQGQEREQIAELLGIKPSTVRCHLNAAFRRLGVHNAPHAVAACFQRGIFTPGEEV